MNNTPFFIVGAPRSGTTLLRDHLRLHPRLEAPEETHFFRWADPFRSPRYIAHYRRSDLFKKHRAMDGIDDRTFQYCLRNVPTRRWLQDWYGKSFLAQRNNPDGRWFEKTPQNIYGIFLICEFYPESKFIHIHRNPLNVVASLMQGRVMVEHDLWGAINSWLESAMIMRQFKLAHADKVLDIPYEKFVQQPREWICRALEFVGEDSSLLPRLSRGIQTERNKYKNQLSDEEVDLVQRATEEYRTELGY